MAVLMVALALFPIVTSKGGTAAGSGSGGLGGSGSGLIATSPSPSVSPSTASGPTFFQYTVRSGDQMWAIAKYFNILLPDLVAANPQVKDPGHLEIGWILNIPPPGWQATASPGAASPT
jgi:LysM repeat protein